MGFAVCVDVGSTYTKAAVVDLDGGELAATAERPTTSDGDVLDGLDAAVGAATAGLGRRAETAPVYVCSSAGGGLRLAVVGHERLVSAQAGERVGRSAGARVVHVAAGRLDGAAVAALRAARPDVLLLVGGTDGGDAEVLLHNAGRLARARLRRPAVVAGNAEARNAAVAALAPLAERGLPVIDVDNVLPRLGELRPGPARAAIREVFLRHVIGGKGLSRGRRFASLVRAATPDAVLAAVELFADSSADRAGGDLVVVDVGGATTDVYSALAADPRRVAAARREVAGELWRERTVEGDLGVRWSAADTVAAAVAERLLPAGAADAAVPDAAELARLAAVIAVRRHARRDPATAGRDLTDVRLLIGSGGVLRHAPPRRAGAVLAAVLADHAGGWAVPRHAATVIDRRYVLAPAGLLAADAPSVARALLRRHLRPG
jgi:uncharacterized protein (TIGR01319 family)